MNTGIFFYSIPKAEYEAFKKWKQTPKGKKTFEFTGSAKLYLQSKLK